MSTNNHNQNNPNRPNPPTPGGNPKPGNPKPGNRFLWIYGVLFLVLIGLNFMGSGTEAQRKDMSWLTLKEQYLNKDSVKKIVVVNGEMAEIYLVKPPVEDRGNDLFRGFMAGEKPDFAYHIGTYDAFNENFQALMKEYREAGKPEVPVMNERRTNLLRDVFIPFIVPLLLIVGLGFMMFRKMGAAGGMGGGGGAGGGIFNIGKSKAQLYEKSTKVNITFNDVAGLDEAKVEVMEIVDFLKNPKKYTALGGKIPRGALLVGPPGTGKTLLAKAVAGEAQVPFFSISGSDFVEMFVGVGASRVRDLFRQAREKAPCIVFIDEIDAIGRARGKNAMMSNDERESTLNQMLVEMDGFGGDTGIIVLAATNRPDVLDSALLRPGRFDRQIAIDVPDVIGREKIFEVHLKRIKTSPNLDVKKLAAQTPGFAGAEIANICNEAALIAARNGKDVVELQDFHDAIDRVIGGLEKKNKIISPEEKRVIAYHEAGHAVAGWYLEHAHPLIKVTIVPRGVAALGYAQYLPKEMYIRNTDHMQDDMCMTLGGRAVEELVFGKISTGALSDLQKVTKVAYAMVSVYGMNDRIGNISFYDPQNESAYSKPYSEETGRVIDEEVKKIVDEAYNKVKALLTAKIDEVTKIAEALLEKEVLFKDDMETLIGKRPFGESSPDQSIDPVANSSVDDVLPNNIQEDTGQNTTTN